MPWIAITFQEERVMTNKETVSRCLFFFFFSIKAGLCDEDRNSLAAINLCCVQWHSTSNILFLLLHIKENSAYNVHYEEKHTFNGILLNCYFSPNPKHSFPIFLLQNLCHYTIFESIMYLALNYVHSEMNKLVPTVNSLGV